MYFLKSETMAYQRVMGWTVLLVVLLAASTVMVQAEDAAHEKTLYEWTVTEIKYIIDSASSTAPEIFENGEKRADTISDSSKEYTDYAKDTVTRAISGKKKPDSQALDLLEKAKKIALDKYQAAKKGSAEFVKAATKEYDTVKWKLSELTQQVKDKMPDNILDQCGGDGRVCQSCHDCCGQLICCRAPDQQGSGNCGSLRGCPYGEGYCP